MTKHEGTRSNKQSYLVEDLSSIYSEAYQTIQVNIDLSSIDKPVKVFAVTSPNPGEGKTTTACNLANLYAKQGKKVIIIDLDLRRSDVHRVLGVENRNGIVDYCSKKATLEEVIKTRDNLDIITAGKATIFPNVVLQSKMLENLISQFRDKYDYIILDTPPVLLVSDVLLLGQIVDGVINVASIGFTKKAEVMKSVRLLKDTNINILGIVVTHDKLKKSYYYYRYHYGQKNH